MLNILIVDDNLDFFGTILMKIYGNDKLNVDEAVTAYTALMKLEEKRYDVVITDYSLPGMNGVEFATIIKEKYKFIKIIFQTSQLLSDVKFGIELSEQIRTNSHLVLKKPPNMIELCNFIFIHFDITPSYDIKQFFRPSIYGD